MLKRRESQKTLLAFVPTFRSRFLSSSFRLSVSEEWKLWKGPIVRNINKINEG